MSKCKLTLFVFGLLVLLAGALPLLKNFQMFSKYLAFLPQQVLPYQIATIILGILAILASFHKEYY